MKGRTTDSVYDGGCELWDTNSAAPSMMDYPRANYLYRSIAHKRDNLPNRQYGYCFVGHRWEDSHGHCWFVCRLLYIV